MGKLNYAGAGIGLPDTELAYLDALTRHAFSEGKAFTVLIRGTGDDSEVVAHSLWFSPQVPVQFIYQDFKTTHISRETFDKVYDSVIDSGVHLVGSEGPLPYEFTGDSPSDGSDE